jgi:hypothetical protein
MSETREGQRFWGKYRGTVVNNIDPNGRGRMLLQVPDVLGVAITSWAEACTPLAGGPGLPMGVWFVPPIGAGVWVEFEQGDPDFPIWTGCRWGLSAEIPSENPIPVAPNLVLQSIAQNTISISSVPGVGGITLKTITGASISINDISIKIDNGKGASIELLGPMVNINGGALTVI